MNVLILTNDQVEALEALNAGGDLHHQLRPAVLADGRQALNADLLEDCGVGQTWEQYGELLGQLTVETDAVFVETVL